MGFFEIISLILKLIGLWEGMLDFIDKKYTADMEKRRQAREKAVDDAVKAETPDEAFDAQDGIVSHSD